MVTAFFMGKFQIAENDHLMTESSLRSEMLMKLVMYLVTHRLQPVSVQELSEALWEDDEIENPAGALKNLMYRLRTQLKEQFGNDSYIITGRGTYRWNPEIEISVDSEEFEKYSKKAIEQGISLKEKRKALEKAVKLYKGEFGAKCKNSYWMVTQATYYHSLYLSDIISLAEILIEAEEYKKLEAICGEALEYDITDENIHYFFVKALMHQNKLELASNHLDDAEHILQETLGIRNSKPLERIRKELLKVMKSDLLSIREVSTEAVTDEDYVGAFQCSFSVFKEIYKLESRRLNRFGLAEQVGMITIANTYTKQVEQFFMKQAMDRLEKIVKGSLRSGDIFTRLNDIQIIMLLPTCTYEAANMVLHRICDEFTEVYPEKGIEFRIDLREVEEYHSRKKGD